MKRFAKLFVSLTAGFFFLEAPTGQPWTHVGDYKTPALCESAFAHTITVNALLDFSYEMQSSTNPEQVADPKQTTQFQCFHER